MDRFYPHDCPLCTFLGTYEIPTGIPFEGKYDLYWCVQTGTCPTVIARHGNADPDYISGMPIDEIFFQKHPTFPTHEAYRRAKALGLKVLPMTRSGKTKLILNGNII